MLMMVEADETTDGGLHRTDKRWGTVDINNATFRNPIHKAYVQGEYVQ